MVSIFLAGIFLFAALSTLYIVAPGYPADKRGWWQFLFALELLVVVLVGGGAIVNFAKRRFLGWSTGLMIFGYCATVWLIPMGIWGIVLLIWDFRRNRTVSAVTGAQELPR